MSAPLLSPGDPPPLETCHAAGRARLILVCDHASNRVPRGLALGIGPAELVRHIAWDIGAAAVTRHLADLLDAPAILAAYSRLVIDLNRDPADPSSIPEESDKVAIPGNRGLDEAARASRRSAIFDPYHRAIADWLAARRAEGIVPALVAIHSFTPSIGGGARPWHAGVLWDEDPRIAVPLLAALRADPSLVVGDNEPYSARKPHGYTVRHHAHQPGLPHVAIELRQDLVADDRAAALWARRLAAVLGPILAAPGLYRLREG